MAQEDPPGVVESVIVVMDIDVPIPDQDQDLHIVSFLMFKIESVNKNISLGNRYNINARILLTKATFMNIIYLCFSVLNLL